MPARLFEHVARMLQAVGPVPVDGLAPAAAFAGGGIAAGLALYGLFDRLGRRASRTPRSANVAVFRALKFLSLGGLGLAGTWGGLRALRLGSDVQHAGDAGLIVTLVVLGTAVGARLGADLVRTYAAHRAGREATSIFVNLTRAGVITLGALIVLQTLGVSITPLVTALGVGGLAVALALQDTLANLFAGIHLLASKKVRVGDFIQLDTGELGYITDITWRNTAIRQLSNNMLLVPNSRLASAVITNFYRPQRELAVLVEVGVAYDSDLERVEGVVADVGAEVMREVQGGVPAFKPMVRYHTFGDSSIDFTVILRAREVTDQYLLKHEFIKRLQRRFADEGIQIPFPIRTVVRAGS